MRKKRRRPRKVSVATKRGHEKEEKKTTKEGGLSPQEGDVRKKEKKKRPRKARRWLREGKVPCVLNQEISFLIHEYLGSERPISVEVSAPTRLSLRGSHVPRKFRQRTTLRSESSTLKGLLYAPIKRRAVPKGLLYAG